jgi:hypothetical protein
VEGLKEMKKTGRIVFGIALLALILCLGCQAKDYMEQIGPYEVNFMLPDDIASGTNMNTITTSTETLDGIPFKTYILELQIQETNQAWNGLSITHFNKTRNMDIEDIAGSAKLDGHSCNSIHQVIDGHDGVIVDCYGSERSNETYRFTYQLDDKTTVSGTLSLDWDTTVLPFLKSLHVEEAGT